MTRDHDNSCFQYNPLLKCLVQFSTPILENDPILPFPI